MNPDGITGPQLAPRFDPVRCYRCGVAVEPRDLVYLERVPGGPPWRWQLPAPDGERDTAKIRLLTPFGHGCAAVLLANANGPQETAGVGGAGVARIGGAVNGGG